MLRLAPSLVLGVSLLASPALAQESSVPTPASAEQLFREGSQLLKAGETEAACAKLSASEEQESAIGTRGLLAYCHERQGLLATALREYEAVAELAHSVGQLARERVAREQVAQLERRVTHVVVVLSEGPPNTQVFVGARRLETAELRAPFASDPGTFPVRALAPGSEPYSATVVVPPDGSTVRIVIPPLARASEPPTTKPAGPPAMTSTHPQPRERSGKRIAAWSGLALGAAGVVLGSYAGVSAIANNRASDAHCHGSTCDSEGVSDRAHALSQARLSNASFGAAALGFGVATYFFLSERNRAGTAAAGLAVTPGGCTLAYERAF